MPSWYAAVIAKTPCNIVEKGAALMFGPPWVSFGPPWVSSGPPWVSSVGCLGPLVGLQFGCDWATVGLQEGGGRAAVRLRGLLRASVGSCRASVGPTPGALAEELSRMFGVKTLRHRFA
jgi:hypothetical protein